MFHYRLLIFCLALQVEAGAFDWAPSCSEPWTTGQWREALQRAAAAALNKDPSYVRYILSAKLVHCKNKKLFFKFSGIKKQQGYWLKRKSRKVKTKHLKFYGIFKCLCRRDCSHPF